jgi:hypothetical protein
VLLLWEVQMNTIPPHLLSSGTRTPTPSSLPFSDLNSTHRGQERQFLYFAGSASIASVSSAVELHRR